MDRRLGARRLRLWLLLTVLTASAWAEDRARLDAALACTDEPQRLVRLACFDRVFSTPVLAQPLTEPETPRSPRWQEAFAQEQGRTPETGALYRDTGLMAGHLVTIAALGTMPPRPLLLAQCHNNITELALLLPKPSTDERVALTLTGDGFSERQLWRIRDGGYAVSGGRGLPAIHTLKMLDRSGQFRIASDAAGIDGLVFDLSGLSQALQPLRQDCGW